ncbi:hypothetical protein T440DRAFT_37438 [Plenodomus tracheiphilus IPT5]|uniref:BTB domain-containing protein n=1 Tax=Plenodomus tracheiphilus IPT5 TaxID=1408161 RepID=A0A6A7BA11_9PLEO|nr:hypothetical protein T440DRAFT_37438 [Plenodomus tracheiphilus IPT5]
MVPPRRPLADITSQVKKNAYFQTAIAEPTSRAPSHVDRKGSPGSAIVPPLISRTIKVIVGADPDNQRIWYLPEALLVRHSILLASMLASSSEKGILLKQCDPRYFSNFVDYIRSSIYSINSQGPEHSALKIHARSCLLGAVLGAQEYCNASLRQLHALFRPSATDRWSCAAKSCIRASDIAFICAQTPPFLPLYYLTPDDGDSLAGLRQLFFDAVASHWTQRDVMQTGTADQNPDTAKWQDVWYQNPDFRAAMRNTVDTWDGSKRSALLRNVGEYTKYSLKPSTSLTRSSDEQLPVFKVEADVDGIEDQQYIGWVGIGPSRPLPPIPSTRRASSERRRRETSETGPADLSVVRGQYEGRQSEDQAVEDEEWREMH